MWSKERHYLAAQTGKIAILSKNLREIDFTEFFTFCRSRENPDFSSSEDDDSFTRKYRQRQRRRSIHNRTKIFSYLETIMLDLRCVLSKLHSVEIERFSYHLKSDLVIFRTSKNSILLSWKHAKFYNFSVMVNWFQNLQKCLNSNFAWNWFHVKSRNWKNA